MGLRYGECSSRDKNEKKLLLSGVAKRQLIEQGLKDNNPCLYVGLESFKNRTGSETSVEKKSAILDGYWSRLN